MKIKTIFLFVIFFTVTIFPQNYYLPINIKKAYDNGTRSYDGRPGKNYWQNTSNYKIKAELNPFSKVITGSEQIDYVNNSPDTLKELIVNLFQNIYKYGSPRNWPIDKQSLHDGVEINKIIVNDEVINLEKETYTFSTILTIKLPSPIVPSSNANIIIDWKVKIPEKSTIRQGAYDSTSMLIAYWYPHIAVYDDIDGWDENLYIGDQEFYNDFSNFDVEISVPSTFIIWATGELQNYKDVLTGKILERYEETKNSETVVKIITTDDIINSNTSSAKGNKTWHFTAENVIDFVFAASDHYLWDGVIYKNSGKKTFISSAYKKESLDFYQVGDIAKKVITYLSEELPGVPYPYPSMTVFNGSGGMEYPMFVNDGSQQKYPETASLTAHEITHTYFPFYMGINERKYAFMDEGNAVMLPMNFQIKEGSVNAYTDGVKQFESFSGREDEMPLVVPSTLLKGTPYRISAYRRSSLAYLYLKNYLGDEVYKKALKDFIMNWNGKHPIPYDFFNSLNVSVNEDLSWFINPWFYEHGYADLSLENVKINNNEVELTIKKIGSLPVPVELKFIDKNGKEVIKTWSTGIWKDKKELLVKVNLDISPTKVLLNEKFAPDSDRKNNIFQQK
ncbi:MAG TPA: M1 family metallopeptidase [Ignavibacteriaceae bacterium]|nr:M1 family metallopeptidase [Ignavibacteriaceae bacterium]